ncbi:senescence-specific cysteine protease SAG39-like protein [Cinnamomum micranthum f. kanehirae]|uniref:Senescence-specific cysteine protease SAG39-like protein n=1 Tax=Cinnamomum micranthum f. kanehirae TaxID=337451 RepID=A0A3S3QED2_9MAGN|nr:senescence-specific cysteine protease SAG39-like protein [Cinnamomum micranthum f. kanehirae]
MAHLLCGQTELCLCHTCSLVDCDTNGEDQGCEGSHMDDAIDFNRHNRCLATEVNFPYTGEDDSCIRKKSTNHAADINDHEDVPVNSEKAVLNAMANQPISVAIDASGFVFQFYFSGVFNGDCCIELDHGFTAVDYEAASDGTKYCLVKNLWGIGWGEEGYIRMQRDVDSAEGLRGIAMMTSYPTA